MSDTLSHVIQWTVTWYLIASLICIGLYAIDKSAAIGGRRRISEMNLFFWGLFGGWPGAILAQQLLRHKTKKRNFRMLFWLSVITNVLALSSLFICFSH